MKERSKLRSYGPWIISVISLFVALSSSAVALQGKNTVDSGDIKPAAVKAQDIAGGAVENRNLAPNAVNGGAIHDGSVTARKLASIKEAASFATICQLGTDGSLCSATCPAGTRLLSGGGNTSVQAGATGTIESTYPEPGDDPKTWDVVASVHGGSGFVGVYALCLDT
jgi:hypothetical protein